MKKFIALILTVILSISIMAPAACAVDANDTPIVILRGDGVELVNRDENGNETEIWPIGASDFDGKIGETAKNILIPFLTEGLLFDKWDNYYKVCYEELSPIMSDVVLDENGSPRNSSGISSSSLNSNRTSCNVDRRYQAKYGATDYTFYYDWRLDPMELADELHKYIEAVKKATGHNKVSLNCRCLGSNVAMAYIYKYGIGSISNLEAGAADANCNFKHFILPHNISIN